MGNTSMVEIGERLKEAREKRSLTIDQAQKQTRIHSSVLMALEEGKCDDMLNPTYAKSFLREYSSYLGLASEDILSQYRALHAGSPNQAAVMNKPAAKESAGAQVAGRSPEAAAGRTNFTNFILAALSLFLMIALLFLGVVLWNKTIRSVPRQRMASRVKEPRLSGRAKASRASDKKKPQAAAAVPKQKKNSPAPAPLPRNMPFNLSIKVKEPVLIQLKKDGVLLFKRVLSRGDVESYKVNEVVNIYVARCEAIELVLDGRVVNVPARGIVRNLEVTRDGVTIR